MENDEKIRLLQAWFSMGGWTDIVLPALNKMIEDMEREFINGPDDERAMLRLKHRIWMAVWMREWPDRLQRLLDNAATQEQLRSQSEDNGAGGSPYH